MLSGVILTLRQLCLLVVKDYDVVHSWFNCLIVSGGWQRAVTPEAKLLLSVWFRIFFPDGKHGKIVQQYSNFYQCC